MAERHVNTDNGSCSIRWPRPPTLIQTDGRQFDRHPRAVDRRRRRQWRLRGFASASGPVWRRRIGVGGKGAGGGTGGNVFVSNVGQIITGSQAASGPNLGQFSDGIDAESIGGGGGNGGFSIGVGVSTGAAVTATLGGNGGAGNSSGTVAVNTQTSVTTYGDQAVGIFAHSIGGGGGNGGFAVARQHRALRVGLASSFGGTAAAAVAGQ